MEGYIYHKQTMLNRGEVSEEKNQTQEEEVQQAHSHNTPYALKGEMH